MNNILIIISHPDDAELMAGGSMLRWIKQGKNIRVISLTNGSGVHPDGKIRRKKEDALREFDNVANYMGYSYNVLNQQALRVTFADENVFQILQEIEEYNIDTLIYPHSGDLHYDHEIASRIAISASRRIPNVLMGQINYFLRDFFTPNIFIDITDTWEDKINALKLYGPWRDDWYEFLDATSTYYGKIAGVRRAEGFISNKFLLE